MKKRFIGIVIALSAVFSASAMAEDSISVTFDGEPLTFEEEQPRLIDGSVMVPMRKIFEAVGANISWDGETKTVTAVKNAQYVKFTADNASMELGVCKDGKDAGEQLYYADSELTSAPVIVNGSMLVPARAVSEAFYYDVSWDGDKKSVDIKAPDNDEGWIYYASWTDGGHMYKIDTNGQRRQILSKNDCYSEGYSPFAYHDDYIYYSTRGENEGCLYRIKTDGTGEEKLTDKKISFLYDIKDANVFDDSGEYMYLFTSDVNIDNSYGYFSDNVDIYISRLNKETGEITQLLDEPVTSAEIYGDYIYFKYKSDTIDRVYSYYRMDKDGSNIIKVTGDLAVNYIRFDKDNDRLKFSGVNSDKEYTSALDGSDMVVTDINRPQYPDPSKYDIDGIMTHNDDFVVGYKYSEDHWQRFYYVFDKDGNKLFEIKPPENAELDYGAKIIGNRIYYTLSPQTYTIPKKLYVDSLDELLGKEYISVSDEKVDGKYEITLETEREHTQSDFEEELHCIDLDKNIDTVILKGYGLAYVPAEYKSDDDTTLYLGKYNDTAERYEYFTSDLDGGNIKPFTIKEESNEADYPKTMLVNEDAKYGITVDTDGKATRYRHYNQYRKTNSRYID